MREAYKGQHTTYQYLSQSSCQIEQFNTVQYFRFLGFFEKMRIIVSGINRGINIYFITFQFSNIIKIAK